MAPDHPNQKLRAQLFLKETDKHIAVWEGQKLSKMEGFFVSGIEQVHWLSHFDDALKQVISESQQVYLYQNEHSRKSSVVETAHDRFAAKMKQAYPLYDYKRLAPIIYELRTIKSVVEVALIQEACRITEVGFKNMLSTVKPGIWEFELEAEYAYHFLRNRSRGFAYEPIIAGGANSCVLHYISNDAQLCSGDLLLMDVGAEYANYNADMTRTIPVNGTFSRRQKQVYRAVLNVKRQATSLLTPGSSIPEYHRAVGELMTSELLSLGLLTEKEVLEQDPAHPVYKKYFMHGTSHHLGLDVHDVGSSHKKIEAGMVFTVEPGIYIPNEGLGIRLEDNILVSESGNINLMRDIPIEIEEIEDLMRH